MRELKGIPKSTENAEVPSTSSANKFSRVERLIAAKRQINTFDESDMAKRLRRVPVEHSVSLDTDVVHWWDNYGKEDQNLSQLALTAVQLPCTQVSVERTFNALGHILTKSRMRLSALSLEKILFVKANCDLFNTHYFKFNLSDTE